MRLFLLEEASRLVLTRFEYVRRTAFLQVSSASLKVSAGSQQYLRFPEGADIAKGRRRESFELDEAIIIRSHEADCSNFMKSRKESAV
jgi:hypothetical protein